MTRRLALCLLLVLAAAGCGSRGAAPPPTVTVHLPAKPASFVLPSAHFAPYTAVPLVGASAPAYAGPATPHSLAAVTTAPAVAKALKNPGVSDALARNGFVVVPASMRLFQYAYEGNVYGGYPVFVTTDVAYHEWHLLYDKVLRTLEQQVLLPKLDHLVVASLAAAQRQAGELKHTDLAAAAAQVEELFAVAAAELGDDVALDSAAQKEKALVDAHDQAHATSPILGLPVDYSLFTPRGHYTRTEKLTRYFVAMSVLGQLPFCLPGTVECPGSGPAQAGVLAARILAMHPDLASLWRQVYEPTAFLVGRADDYTPLELSAAAAKADAGWPGDVTPLADGATLAKALDALVAARPALINPERAAIRFLGTRFTVDAYLLDQLVAPNVGTSARPRLTPSALDVAAAFGSSFAYDTMKAAGQTAYAHYDDQLEKVREAVSSRPAAQWGSTVYDAWLYALAPMFAPHGAQFPDFMRTGAWAAKDHQAGLGSYAELKHDTILYAKQFFAEGGDSVPPSPLNWVEPDPAAFGRLAAAADLLGQGLQQRSLLTPALAKLVADERDLDAFFERIARDELAGTPIGSKDNDRLRFVGSDLESLWFRTSDESREGTPTEDQADALVADLGSSAKGVLEIATGRVDRIYVLVPDGKGGFQVAVGGVYSYYEFRQPPGQRLDDATWRAMLDKGTAPARAAWTDGITKGSLDRLGYGGP